MSKEDEAYRFHVVRANEPVHPVPLIPELSAFLQTQDVACVMQETTTGTVYVVKLPGQEIESVGGIVPIRTRHEFYAHPQAPVIRTVITVYDQPASPLALETMTNIAEPDQRADFERLAEQEETHLLFYDERLCHRLSKRIKTNDPETILKIVSEAEALRRLIPTEEYDFMAAKADVMRHTKL